MPKVSSRPPRSSSRLALLARQPQAMQLRYFAALHDTASERSSTIVFSAADGSAHSSRPTTGRGEVTLIRSDFLAGFTMGASSSATIRTSSRRESIT